MAEIPTNPTIPTINIPTINIAPLLIVGPNINREANQSIGFSFTASPPVNDPLITVPVYAIDSDGAVAQYRFTEDLLGPENGYLTFNGARISGASITVSAADIGRVGYFTGTGQSSLKIQAIDNLGATNAGAGPNLTINITGQSGAAPASPQMGTENNDSIVLDATFSGNINAGGGDDSVVGNDRDNFIDGGTGNDVISGGKGADTLNGASGIDTAGFQGVRSTYTITTGATGRTVTDSVAGRDGADTLSNIERLQFSDGVLAFDNLRTDTAGKGYLLYRAAFDRAPDASGLGYWIRELDRGQDYGAVVAASFIASPEFVRLYGNTTSNAAFINLVYQNVLDRAPDQAGSDYWLGQLNSGYARSNMLASFAVSDENYNSVAPLIADGIWFV